MEEWVVVHRTPEQVELELVRGLLETNGIKVVVEAKGWKSMTVFFGQSALGEWLLKVPPDQAHLAEELLAAGIESDDAEAE